MALLLTSCGASKVRTEVVNSATGTSISITQSANGGQTTVDVKPSVAVSADSTKILTK